MGKKKLTNITLKPDPETLKKLEWLQSAFNDTNRSRIIKRCIAFTASEAEKDVRSATIGQYKTLACYHFFEDEISPQGIGLITIKGLEYAVRDYKCNLCGKVFMILENPAANRFSFLM
jgi:hypothetical protein